MENIFLFFPNKYLKKPRTIERFIYNMIPLNDVNNPLVSLDNFKKILLVKIDAAKDINDIVNLTLNLCEQYLYPQIPQLSPYAYLGSDSLLIQSEIENFNDSIFKNDYYKNELSTLMVMSHLYTKSFCLALLKRKIKNC